MLRRILLDLLAPAVLGGLTTLGFAPFNYYGLTLVAVTGLVALWWNAGRRRAAWRGFVFGLANFGTGVYWPYVSMHSYFAVPPILAAALVGLLAVYLALYPAAVGAFAGATSKRVARPLWALVFVPGAWLFGELIRSWVLTGFPWLSLGYSMIDSPLAALAPLGGVYFLSLLMIVGAGAVVLLLAGSLVGRAIALALIAVTPLAIWAVPPPGHWTQPAAKTLSADIVQGNFPMEIKSLPQTLGTTLTRYQRLTAASDADLVVWPETAVPVPAIAVRGYLADIGSAARRKNQTVLAGILDWNEGSYYNAVLALGAGQGRYYKRHLVPFSEYFPVPGFVMRILDGINSMRFSDLGFGPPEQTPITVDGVKLGLSICFEDAFGYEIARALPAAGILVNVTNDAWFRGTIADDQHLQIARMRSLEFGRVLLRAANTGISAIIDYDGRVRQRTAQFTVATLNDRITPRLGATPYLRFGDTPLWIGSSVLVVLGLLLAVWQGRRQRRAVT